MSCLSNLELNLKFNESLKDYTTFKIGGAADVFARPRNTNELEVLIKLLIREGEKFFILGCGSNILVSDEGYRGVVITLRQGEFLKIEGNCENLKVGAGVKISTLLSWCRKNGCSGIEFMAGIPASIGGAIKQNAGTGENNMADVLKDITYLDKKGEVRILPIEKLNFSYRCLNLDFSAITAATLKLKSSTAAKVAENIRFSFDLKRKKHPLGEKSAGCIFKNPPFQNAGFLIESVGLKGTYCKDACVSEKHGNFIVNRHDAAAKDVLYLINLIKEEIKLKKNVLLETEVEILS